MRTIHLFGIHYIFNEDNKKKSYEQIKNENQKKNTHTHNRPSL